MIDDYEIFLSNTTKTDAFLMNKHYNDYTNINLFAFLHILSF